MATTKVKGLRPIPCRVSLVNHGFNQPAIPVYFVKEDDGRPGVCGAAINTYLVTDPNFPVHGGNPIPISYVPETSSRKCVGGHGIPIYCINQQELLDAIVGINPETTFNFDEGSYLTFAEESPGVYRITPVTWNAGAVYWSWWGLRSGKFEGQTPHFKIAKASHYSLNIGEWLACWSTDLESDSWTKFDNINIGATDIEFYNNSAFPSGIIYITASPAYPFSRTVKKISEWKVSPYVSDTTSTSSLIAGYTSQRANGDGTGRTAPSFPRYGFKVSNATPNSKKNIVITSGVHANETQGRYALEGAVDWLLLYGAMQKFLLDWTNIYIYPSIFPQAINQGYARTDVQTPNNSCDYIWDTSAFNDEVDAYKTIWSADVNNLASVFWDFHGRMSIAGTQTVTFDSTTPAWVRMKANLLALDPAYSAVADIADSGGKELTGYWTHLATPPSIAGWLEEGLSNARGPSNWKNAGVNMLKATAQLVAGGYISGIGPSVGSRSFNGTTDRIDFDTPWTASGPMTVSFWVNMASLPSNAYVWFGHDPAAGPGYILINISNTTNGYIGFIVDGTTDLQRSSAAGAVTVGSWLNFITTWDGSANYSGVHIYKANTELGYSVNNNGANLASLAIPKWSFGGRIADDLRNLPGKLAQFAVWDYIMDDTQRGQLALGYAPSLVDGSSHLKFYLPMNTTSLVASPGGTGTPDGTTHSSGAGNGPAIIY